MDENKSIELYKSNGTLVFTKQGENEAKATTVSIAKAKAIKDAFPELGKIAIAQRRDEAGVAVKTLACMEIGALQANQSVIGTGIRHVNLKNGNVRHTYTLLEQRNQSAQEKAAATFLGMTVEELRAFRKERASKIVEVKEVSNPTAVAA